MNKINVVHVITRLDPGGSSTNTIETVARLDAKKFNMFLISGRTHDPDSNIEDLLKKKKISCLFLPDLRREIDPWRDLKAFFQLYAFFKRRPTDIVHTHSSKAGILGRWAAKSAGVACIIHTPHGHVFYGYFGKWKTALFIWMERLTALITTRIITLTETGRREHIDFKIAKADKFTAIYSGIDLEGKPAFASIEEKQRFKKQWNVPPERLVFGCAARLEPIKGISYLVEAMHQTVGRWPACHLLVVGDGPQKEALQAQVHRVGLNDHVTFTGFQKQVLSFIECMDVFVLPSLNEGMGRVLLEAMACGKPVIASSVGGIPELIDEGVDGFLVGSKDPTALALAMSRFLEDVSLSPNMGNKAKMKITGKFGLDQMVQNIEHLYEHCL